MPGNSLSWHVRLTACLHDVSLANGVLLALRHMSCSRLLFFCCVPVRTFPLVTIAASEIPGAF